MKKLLSILAALGLSVSAASTLVACGDDGSNPVNPNNNDDGWAQWTNTSDAKWELTSGKVGGTNDYGKFIVPDNGEVKGKLTLSIKHNVKSESLNASELFRISTRKNPFWTNRDPLNKSLYSFDFDLDSRQTIDYTNDSIVVNASLNLGESRDYDYVQFITIQYAQMTVESLNNKNYDSTFEDISWSDSSVFIQQIVFKKWWDDSSDFYKAKDIKLTNNDSLRKLSFTFKAKKGDNTNFVLGKNPSGNNDYEAFTSDDADGAIAKIDTSNENYDLFEANYSFTSSQWHDFSLRNTAKDWMYRLGVATKIEESDYYAIGIRSLVDSKEEADDIIKAENNVSISLEKGGEFGPSADGVALNTQVGPFINLSDYNLKPIVKVGNQDVSDFFAAKVNDKGKIILDVQTLKVWSKAAQWNMFIKKYNDILATNSSATINVEISASGRNGDSILSNVLSLKMADKFINSSINNDKEKIISLDSHYVTGIYAERTVVIDYQYKDDITKAVGLMNNNSVACIITNQKVIETYGTSLALVEFDMHLYNISEDEGKTIGIGYRPDYLSSDQSSYEIGELNLSSFYPKGFVDSSFSIEGYDSNKGVQISSEKRTAVIGKLTYGENIDISNLKVTINDASSIQPIDTSAAGINVYLNDGSLYIELTDNFNGKCIRPYNFDGTDNDVDSYGAYKLRVNISVPTKLNAYKKVGSTIDNISYSPSEDDTISLENWTSQNLEFDYSGYINASSSKTAFIAIKRSGKNVDWDSFNSSSENFHIDSVAHGGISGEASLAIEYLIGHMSVKFDNDKQQLNFNLAGTNDAREGNKFSYLAKDGAEVTLSINLKTKNGKKVIFNLTNNFKIYFRNK